MVWPALFVLASDHVTGFLHFCAIDPEIAAVFVVAIAERSEA